MKLLILDMDETLLHTNQVFGFADEQDKHDYDFEFMLERNLYQVTKRPHLDEFLDYAFANFKVAIWTAGGRDYATGALRGSGIYIPGLEFFWTRGSCTIKMDYELGLYYGLKKLNKVRKLGYDLKETLIVDDVRETASDNYGNLIKIKPFNDRSVNDTELLKLKKYLEKIKDEPNFRRVEKRGWDKNL